MKTSRFILAAIFAGAFLFSCTPKEQPETIVPDPTTPEVQTGVFTVQANKSELTKALTLEGTTLKAAWSFGESVGVYRPGDFSTKLGVLYPTTLGASSTILSGTIDLTGLNVNDKLFLLYPDNSWTYYGQDGTLATVSSDYDYATATVTVATINGGNVSASDAAFQNRQAIVTFKLKNKDADKAPLAVSDFVLFSGSRNVISEYDLTFWPVTSDNISVKLSVENPVSELTLAVPTISPNPDSYRFYARVIDSSWNETLYETIANNATFLPGKYYSGNLNMYAVRYTVVGSPASVFTNAWDASITDNDLEFNGSYFMKYVDIPGPCEVVLKVAKSTKDGTAYYPDGGEETNIVVTALAAGGLLVLYGPADDAVSTNMWYPSDPGTIWTVAGNSGAENENPDPVFGTEWDRFNTANDMVLSGGNYVKTYSAVPAGTEMYFKVVKNRSWSESYGGAGDTNYYYKVLADGDVTISFDDANKIISVLGPAAPVPYTLYVLDEKIATGSDWGSARSIWYGGLTSDIPSSGTETIGTYTYNKFILTDAVVNNTADIYYKGENGCEVKLPSVAVTSANKNYYYRTDGVQQTAVTDPANPEALDATPRFWLRSSVTDLHCHMWGGSYDTSWPGTAATMVDAKQYDHNWYYVDIIPGTAHMIFNSPGGGWQTADLDTADPNVSYYYYIYGGDNYQPVTW